MNVMTYNTFVHAQVIISYKMRMSQIQVTFLQAAIMLKKKEIGFMGDVTRKVFDDLEQFGYRVAVVPITHLDELHEQIVSTRSLNPDVDKNLGRYLDKYDYTIPETLKEAKSILVVAVPQPISRMHFMLNGKNHTVIMPPTYLLNTSVENEDKQKFISAVNENLKKAFTRQNYKVVKTNLPGKLAAVKSDLGAYGKNNICYIGGENSFYWIGVYLSDMPCDDDTWGEGTVLEECANCNICRDKCPTNAIAADRFLVYAERCITYHNESSEDFPDWIEPEWHNAVIGCMYCQLACPVNKDSIHNIKDLAEFDENETRMILEGTPLDRLPKDTYDKLEAFNFIEEYGILPRNLKVLLR
jgi:epoxyqueuosine reductase